MASSQSSWTVLAAIVAGVGLTTIKFVAAVLGGSAGMLAEAVHSLVDTLNSVLLHFGQDIDKGKKAAQEKEEKACDK